MRLGLVSRQHEEIYIRCCALLPARHAAEEHERDQAPVVFETVAKHPRELASGLGLSLKQGPELFRDVVIVVEPADAGPSDFLNAQSAVAHTAMHPAVHGFLTDSRRARELVFGELLGRKLVKCSEKFYVGSRSQNFLQVLGEAHFSHLVISD